MPTMIRGVCETCGAEFFREKRAMHGGNRGRFCCLRCANVANGKKTMANATGEKNPCWKGGVSKDYSRYKKRYEERHPEKVRANRLVAQAVQTGTLTKRPCEQCGATEKIHAHHDDYTKLLVVRWLCASCHRKHHGASC